MRLLIGICLILMHFSAWATNKEEFLSAWEAIQQSSDEVERFEKISERKYNIKFSTLPFEGEMIVLAYDIEPISSAGLMGDEYTLAGYVEVDLVNASEDLIRKYNRTYYKWAENNNLYYNSKSTQWVTAKSYSDDVQSQFQGEGGSLFFWISEYSGYILAILFIYIIYTLIFGNKHLKLSLKQQKQALDDMDYTKEHMEEALTLHKETNRLLTEILQSLKERQN